jgi:RNA polymerase sigma-70 factor (ECF subfamily)
MSASARIPSEHDEDGALARAHLDGDREAFAILYRRYYPDLVRYVARRGADHARAEDVAQETLARAYRYFGGFDPSRPVWPWLRTIATRIAAVEAGRRSNEVLVDDPATDAAVPGGDPVDAIAGRVTLAQAMRQLPLRQRDALLLRYVEDRQPSDIAASFGLTRTAFEQLLWRARRSLAREYAKVTTALMPLALRLRRAAARCQERAALASTFVLNTLGNAVVGVSVTVAGATAILPTFAASPTALAAPRFAGVAASVTDPAGHDRDAYARPAVPVPVSATADDGHVHVSVRRDAGPASTTQDVTLTKSATGSGTVVEHRRSTSTSATGDRGGRIYIERRGSGPTLLCSAVPGLCDLAAQ